MTAFTPPNAADLKRLFTQNGVRPKRRLGQNFMVSAAAMEFLAHAADLTASDVALEPGAGTGGLTTLLAEQAGAVLAVELDRKLHSIASEVLAGRANVQLIHADIMGAGDRMASSVTEALRRILASKPGHRYKVVANLPYSVSTAFITAALAEDIVPSDMIVTVQREVADRLCAKPGTGDYGYLTVVVRSVARVRRLKRLSPRVFWPQPEVESCIVRITPDAALREGAGDLGQLQRVAGALFGHRRKLVVRNMVLAKLVRTRQEANRVLHALGLPETVRPEEVAISQYVRLARRFS